MENFENIVVNLRASSALDQFKLEALRKLPT